MSKQESICRQPKVRKHAFKSQTWNKSRPVTPVYSVDVTQFRALVHHLTGFSSSSPCAAISSHELDSAAQHPLHTFHSFDEAPLVSNLNHRYESAQMTSPMSGFRATSANSTNASLTVIRSLTKPAKTPERPAGAAAQDNIESNPHGQCESNAHVTPALTLWDISGKLCSPSTTASNVAPPRFRTAHESRSSPRCPGLYSL